MCKKSIAFYTEAGTSKGMGHLVRCHTIGEKFTKNNYIIDFYLNSDINFDYKYRNIIYFEWNNIPTKRYDIIIIDSYLASLDIYNNLSKRCTLLVCIDDYNRIKYPKSLIINFSPDCKELFFQKLKNGYHYLLGLKYIPIRQKLLDTHVQVEKKIFIMLGGMDTQNLSVKILQTLQNITIKKVIVINKKETVSTLKKFKDTEVLYQPTDLLLTQHMASSSIAICTASMSLYELSYLKVPTIAIALNKNQEIGIKQSIKHHIAISYCNIKEKNWQKKLQYQTLNIKFLEQQDIIIDGKGTQRIITKIERLLYS